MIYNRLSREDFTAILQVIVETFPTEDKNIYYVQPKNSTQVMRGQLYGCYRNYRTQMAKACLIKARTYKKKPSQDLIPSSSQAATSNIIGILSTNLYNILKIKSNQLIYLI